jgi:hypothetical protein
MNKASAALLLLMLAAAALPGQREVLLRGQLLDAESGSAIPLGSLHTEGGSWQADAAGYFSLLLPPGPLLLRISAPGYLPLPLRLSLQAERDTQMRVLLLPVGYRLAEVPIEAQAPLRPESMNVLPVAAMRDLPQLGGEADVLRMAQALPGVQQGNEGNTGLYVRGSNADQAAVLLDDAPLYQPAHLLGLAGALPADAVQQAALHSGPLRPSFQERAGALLDLRMREGDKQAWKGSAGIGLLFSDASLEGPLSRRQGLSVLGSLRYGTFGGLQALAGLFSGSDVRFADALVKVSGSFSPKAHGSLLVYGSEDRFSWEGSILGGAAEGSAWGNRLASLRYIRQLRGANRLLISLYASQYTVRSSFESLLLSGISQNRLRDLGFRSEVQRHAGSRREGRLGATLRLRGIAQLDSLGRPLPPALGHLDLLAFGEQRFRLAGRWEGEAGLAFRAYVPQSGRPQAHLAPYGRLSGRLGDGGLLWVAAGTASQALHQLSSTIIAFPTDAWMQAGDLLPLLTTATASAGFAARPGPRWQASAACFFRQMQNMPDFRDGVFSWQFLEDLPRLLAVGGGRAWGMEIMARKEGRRAWVQGAYTYSRTIRWAAEVNGGRPYPASYDRPHAGNVQASFRPASGKWQLGLAWTLQSGRTQTVPLRYWGAAVVYSDRNAYRLPVYHRADVSATYRSQVSQRVGLRLHVSIYNVYNRLNIYAVAYSTRAAEAIALFPLLPACKLSLDW